MRLIWIFLPLALGCSGQTVEEPGAVGGAKAKGEVKDGGEMTAPTSEELASITGVQHLQTPSPKEMQVILSKSGVTMSAPADRNFSNVGNVQFFRVFI